jgi:hypothetical protein
MEEKRHKRLYLLALSGAAVLLLAGLLTLAAGEFVRGRLIQPLLLLFQVVGVYLRAIPQLGIWLFVLLFFVLLSSYFLRSPQPARSERRQEPEEGARRRPGLIADLAERIELGHQGEYFKWRVRRELRDFLVDLLAWREDISSEEALESVRSGEWTADPRVREFFRRGFERHYTLLVRLQEFLSSLSRRRDETFEQDLAFIVSYLEGFAGGAFRGPHEVDTRRERSRWS